MFRFRDQRSWKAFPPGTTGSACTYFLLCCGRKYSGTTRVYDFLFVGHFRPSSRSSSRLAPMRLQAVLLMWIIGAFSFVSFSHRTHSSSFNRLDSVLLAWTLNTLRANRSLLTPCVRPSGGYAYNTFDQIPQI
jgi:hypothetical protein